MRSESEEMPPADAATRVRRGRARDLVDRVEKLALEAEAAVRPLETDPYRARLFELFAEASLCGFLVEGNDPDLTCDALARQLAMRWNLEDSVRRSHETQTRIAEASLHRMRLMWSVLRMWMDWTYAWERWDEFHPGSA